MSRRLAALSSAVTLSLGLGPALAQDLPAAIAAPGHQVFLSARAEGAQIYECAAEDSGTGLTWHLREPIATLIHDGKTIGRHFVGPTWEATGGGSIRGKVAASVPAPGGAGIPWLRLDVVARAGEGPLAEANVVQRIDTQGGAVSGSCAPAGAFRVEPYSATYVFLR